jgi:POTRA domain-containing FtsQ-type protein
MPAYQGRALTERGRPRRRGRGRVLATTLAAVLAAVALAHLPWDELRASVAVVTEIRVTGVRYLGPERVRRIAGLRIGQDLFATPLERARQALLLDSRIADAEVRRRLPRGLEVWVREREPVLLVHHGVPWELDSAGVLLAPLESGVVADVPLLVGARLAGVPAGAHVGGDQVARGLAWIRSLSQRELQLQGRVSELDVSAERWTALALLDGTRILAPAWPPSLRRLSALRVVLADLEKKGLAAAEVDLRFEHQVIVRPFTIEGDSEASSG